MSTVPSESPMKKKANSRQSGFTLIELMVVIAVVSILAVIALPAYLDYVVRSKVSEGMVFIAEAKTSVSEYYYSNGMMPANNSEAGLQPADDYDDYEFISKLEISSSEPTSFPGGTIEVTIKIPGSTADGKKLQLVPSTNGPDQTLIWTCQPAPAPDGISTMQIPANCRNL